jgi:hypothetical protein
LEHYQVRLRQTIEIPWTNMQPLSIGDVPKGLGTPSYYCTVERGEEPSLLEPYRLLNLYSEWLGYEGVQISSVQDDRVMGTGNCPPFDEPAGQIPFTLSLHTGKMIT